MAFPPPPQQVPPPPGGGAPSRSGWSTRAIVLTVVVAMLAGLVVVGIAGFVTYRLVDDGSGAEASPSVTPPPDPGSTAPEPEVPAELRSFYEQELGWTDCGENQCARLTVPLDYAEPDGETIEIAVLRVRAGEPDERVGQLVVNPGGPGGSGVDYAAGGGAVFGATLARYYDIVGFDPRGVGQSTALECATTAQTDEFLASDPDPDTRAEVQRNDRLTRAYGEGCLERSGDLARHVSTVEVARDVDVLRAALGERQLDWFGASYGTTIGATYAELFPANVRRMVLDGAVAQNLPEDQMDVDQARGFQTALDAYLRDCLDKGCFLGEDLGEAQRRLSAFLEDVDAEPLPTGVAERPLTEGLAVYGIFLPLYVQSYWPLLTEALRRAIQDGDGSQLLTLADQYTQRTADGYQGNQTEALYAVNCADSSESVPLADVPDRFGEFEAVAPVFARIFAYGLATCDSWPIEPTDERPEVDGKGAAPILVVGTTRDPATPYRWAEELSEELDSGVLLSRDGDGHTAFQQGNACIDKAVEAYLVAGKVPEDGRSC
ncbi:alpha/beta hydrolase [Nocardioides aurantiacus]|uniref:Alpha/beta hydrolase family protein n=1 Tax=Nocardioides aurantiacus TaxID=86796 RepID=A0A3N2CPB3_9ACTN|nr:alpha/beta hydrolase [Nocardioides aurantiacus]ROR89361.1 alpha/beta hydrolase family protein [Nocardioides aurantiacus]